MSLKAVRELLSEATIHDAHGDCIFCEIHGGHATSCPWDLARTEVRAIPENDGIPGATPEEAATLDRLQTVMEPIMATADDATIKRAIVAFFRNEIALRSAETTATLQGVVADLRRKYHHVVTGGQLSAHDVGYHIETLERLIDRLENGRTS